jgi:hypothetical protein
MGIAQQRTPGHGDTPRLLWKQGGPLATVVSDPESGPGSGCPLCSPSDRTLQALAASPVQSPRRPGFSLPLAASSSPCPSRLLKNPCHGHAGCFRWRQGDLRDKAHLEPLPAPRPRQEPPEPCTVAPQGGRAFNRLMRPRLAVVLSNRLPCPAGLAGSPQNSRGRLTGFFNSLLGVARLPLLGHRLHGLADLLLIAQVVVP